MTCPGSPSESQEEGCTAATTGSASTPISQAHDLLVSLVHWWPYAPHQQCPSLLLCGPTLNGKSHLVRQAVQDANAGSEAVHGTPELVAQERRRHVIAVTPRLAQAAATQNARDGCTGLRRLLRRAILTACLDARHACNASGTSTRSEPSELSVVLVLDHMELYVTHDASFVSGGGGATGDAAGLAAARGGGEDATSSNGAGSVETQYPALLADLYTVLRSAPPLFVPEECATLKLSTLVFVSLFTGELEEVHPLVRHRYVDFALSLPTPTEAERRTFFQQYCAPLRQESESAELLPALLADALALRTGGVSYGGLREIVALALDEVAKVQTLSSTPLASPSSQSVCATWDLQTAGASAQRTLHAYQTSGSVTALEYRRSAGYVDVQVTRWHDIAGMTEVKTALRRLVTDPIRHRDAYRSFRVRPSTGLLLHGPPGTGKTMLAKAMATELNASFIYMDLPDLVQSEVGESERRLQAYFDIARERSPSVVFMDEVQAAFGVRYAAESGRAATAKNSSAVAAISTSHDARLVSHLLRLLDAAQQDEEHFVLFVGATNVVHLLDPLLLRAGRLDTLLEVPLPDAAARESLVQRVVYGEWAGWFSRADNNNSSGGVSASEESQQQQQSPRVQPALVEEFVRLSDGFSGAQVRNFLSVFGLQLARRISRRGLQPADRDGFQTEGEPMGYANIRDEARLQQRSLQNSIASFLTSTDPMQVLSSEAVALLRLSHERSLS